MQIVGRVPIYRKHVGEERIFLVCVCNVQRTEDHGENVHHDHTGKIEQVKSNQKFARVGREMIIILNNVISLRPYGEYEI